MGGGWKRLDGEPDGIGGGNELLSGLFGQVIKRGLGEGMIGVGAQEHEADGERGGLGIGGGGEGDGQLAAFLADLCASGSDRGGQVGGGGDERGAVTIEPIDIELDGDGLAGFESDLVCCECCGDCGLRYFDGQTIHGVGGALATGAGANGRISLGLSVLSGIIASTCLAVLFVPSFFAVLQWFEEWRKARKKLLVAAARAAQ